MKCSFMYTIDEETIFTTEINLPYNMNFSEALEYIKNFILAEGHDFNDIKGLSILIKK
jgi:hypothetical protein